MNRKCLQFITCLSLGMNLFYVLVSGGHKSSIVLLWRRTIWADYSSSSRQAGSGSSSTVCCYRYAVIHNLNHNFEIQHRYNMQYCPCTLFNALTTYCYLARALNIQITVQMLQHHLQNNFISLSLFYSHFLLTFFFSLLFFGVFFFFLFPSVDR